MGKGEFSPVEKRVERNRQNGKGDTNGGSDSDTSETQIIPPPDGGWGWMVVFSSFLIHVIADGIVYSFGVFLMEFVVYFKAGRGAASWIGALQPAVTFTVGPLSSALTNRYGCRKVTIIGAIISAIGFILSFWAPNLYYLYFTAGVMAGVGFGLIYLPAIVCVAQYFEKRRSFATGLAVCGSGFGTFVLAPLTKLLVHEYSWRGAMLILGGIILNVVVCGIIFRPLEPEGNSPKKSSSEPEGDVLLANADQYEFELLKEKSLIAIEVAEIPANDKKDHIDDKGDKILDTPETLEIVKHLQQLKALPNGNGLLLNQDNSVTSQQQTETETVEQRLSSETHLDDLEVKEYCNNSGKTNSKYQLSASQSIVSEPYQNSASFACSDSELHKQPTEQSGEDASTIRRRRIHRNSETSHTSSVALPPLQRKDVFYSGSLQNIPMYRSQPDVYLATVTAPHDQDTHSLSVKGDAKTGGCFNLSEEFRSTMKDMLSMSLLKNPVFLMFGFSNFFTSIGFNMPFIFLPDRAKLAGIDEDKAALLLSVIGIANTAGRVIFGFLSDQPWVNRLMLYNTALTICGVATALSPFVGGVYGLLVAYAAIFGVFIGVYVSLTSIVLVDLLGLEYLTNSFGLLLLFQGAATFVGPPIAGWLYDGTGSYDISFILMGILIAFSGAMLFFLPCVQRHQERQIPKEKIEHDMELGKHSVIDEDVEFLGLHKIPSKV